MVERRRPLPFDKCQRIPACSHFWSYWSGYTDPKTCSTNQPELRQTTDPRPGHLTQRLNVLQGAQTNMCARKVFKVLSHRSHFSLVCRDALGHCAPRRVIKSTNDLCRYGCTVIGEEHPRDPTGLSEPPGPASVCWLRQLGGSKFYTEETAWL